MLVRKILYRLRKLLEVWQGRVAARKLYHLQQEDPKLYTRARTAYEAKIFVRFENEKGYLKDTPEIWRFAEERERQRISDLTDSELSVLRSKRRTKAEDWVEFLGRWIPGQHREQIVGDILDDCNETREDGCGEWRIKVQMLRELILAVITLIPGAILQKLVRMWSAE